MATGYPVVLVCGVDACHDGDAVVDFGCFGSFAPMASGVVLKEFGAGFSVGRGVEVFTSVVGHRTVLVVGALRAVVLGGVDCRVFVVRDSCGKLRRI